MRGFLGWSSASSAALTALFAEMALATEVPEFGKKTGVARFPEAEDISSYNRSGSDRGIGMPKYFVRFACPLRVRLSTYAQLQGKNRVLKQFTGAASTQPSFVLYDLVQKEGAVSLPHGVGFDAHIEAPNIAEAIKALGKLQSSTSSRRTGLASRYSTRSSSPFSGCFVHVRNAISRSANVTIAERTWHRLKK